VPIGSIPPSVGVLLLNGRRSISSSVRNALKFGTQ